VCRAALSTVFFALGWIISPFWGMNKQTWSPSYLFFMAGSCGYLLILLYVVYGAQYRGSRQAQ
jgi:predicted acyltransferase